MRDHLWVYLYCLFLSYFWSTNTLIFSDFYSDTVLAAELCKHSVANERSRTVPASPRDLSLFTYQSVWEMWSGKPVFNLGEQYLAFCLSFFLGGKCQVSHPLQIFELIFLSLTIRLLEFCKIFQTLHWCLLSDFFLFVAASKQSWARTVRPHAQLAPLHMSLRGHHTLPLPGCLATS